MPSDSPYYDRIVAKLTEALAPTTLVVRDDSQRHAGHADRVAALGKGGTAGEMVGETHFHVEVTTSRFEGLSRIDRQRLVNDLLADELRERIHALSLKCRAPSEISPSA